MTSSDVEQQVALGTAVVPLHPMDSVNAQTHAASSPLRTLAHRQHAALMEPDAYGMDPPTSASVVLMQELLSLLLCSPLCFS